MKVSLNLDPKNGPEKLEFSGLKLLIEVSTATINVSKNGEIRKSILVWALIDTGAYKTHISYKIGEYLGLEVLGGNPNVQSSGGPIKTTKYVIDLKFIDYDFKPFNNFDVESLEKFKFDLTTAIRDPMEQKNVGVLIGRDILSKWNMNWDGPRSTVTISE